MRERTGGGANEGNLFEGFSEVGGEREVLGCGGAVDIEATGVGGVWLEAKGYVAVVDGEVAEGLEKLDGCGLTAAEAEEFDERCAGDAGGSGGVGLAEGLDGDEGAVAGDVADEGSSTSARKGNATEYGFGDLIIGRGAASADCVGPIGEALIWRASKWTDVGEVEVSVGVDQSWDDERVGEADSVGVGPPGMGPAPAPGPGKGADGLGGTGGEDLVIFDDDGSRGGAVAARVGEGGGVYQSARGIHEFAGDKPKSFLRRGFCAVPRIPAPNTDQHFQTWRISCVAPPNSFLLQRYLRFR